MEAEFGGKLYFKMRICFAGCDQLPDIVHRLHLKKSENIIPLLNPEEENMDFFFVVVQIKCTILVDVSMWTRRMAHRRCVYRLAQGKLRTLYGTKCKLLYTLFLWQWFFYFLVSIYRFDGTKCTAFYRFIVLLFCLNIGIELNFRRMMSKMHHYHRLSMALFIPNKIVCSLLLLLLPLTFAFYSRCSPQHT